MSAPARDTAWIMQQVLLATVPGVLALTAFFGWGSVLNILWAIPFALAFEALALRLRRRPVRTSLRDCSALLSAVLLAVALPPAAPWWLIATGCGFAILVAKHSYGGLGHNPFNPAMVGYAVLLLSFPLEMSRWLAPAGATQTLLSPLGALQASLGLLDANRLDAFTMATPLAVLKQDSARMISEMAAAYAQFGAIGGRGWEWVNAGFLLGGLFLLWRRIYSWHAPLGMLGALALMATVFHDGGSSASSGPALFQLFSGATMLGAFFIVTDPASCAASRRGRLYCGVLTGVLLFVLRHWGSHADALAFAVLLMNLAAPLLDRLTVPRPQTIGPAP